MKKLACKDIDPSSTCSYEATGKSPQEVARRMMAHLKSEHPDAVEKMGMSDDELMVMLEEKVH